MSQESVFLEHVSAISDLRGRLSQADSQQQGICRDMKDPVPPWAKMMTLSRFYWSSWRRQRCQPTGSSPPAACSARKRYAVARANSGRVNKTCTCTARAVFLGRCFRF